MKTETIALIGLIVIIIIAVSAAILLQPAQNGKGTLFDEIIKNLIGEEPEPKQLLELGDCVKINYTGRNYNTREIFDSSYSEPENKTGGTPLRVYMSYNQSAVPPEGYEQYSAGIIEGLMEGLVEAQLYEGDTQIIGPIPPEKAYGLKPEVGDTFTFSAFDEYFNQTLEIIEISDSNIKTNWIGPVIDDIYTLPQFYLFEETNFAQIPVTILPPYFLWKNASVITNLTDDEVTFETTPTAGENLVDEIQTFYIDDLNNVEFVFPDATTAEWNDTTITLTNDPEIGAHYSITQSAYGQTITMNITVVNMTDEKINLSYGIEGYGDPQIQQTSRVIDFNTTVTVNRKYNMSIMEGQTYLSLDLEPAGYSLHDLAGETLDFEVDIDEVYKQS